MADAGDLYDEFGNYIGPELSESEEVRLCHMLPPAALVCCALRVELPACAAVLLCGCCTSRMQGGRVTLVRMCW